MGAIGRGLRLGLVCGILGCGSSPLGSGGADVASATPVSDPAAEAAVAADAQRALERAQAEAEARARAEAEALRLHREEEARALALAAEKAREEAARAAFEAAYPLHGVTFHFLAQVRAQPTPAAPVVGYMRRGSQFRASERVPGTGCARGWHEVPGGGFVCRGEGYIVGAGPQSFEPAPAPPSLDDALPYAYGYAAADGVGLYWRLPSEAEERQATTVMEALAASRAKVAAATPDAVATADAVAADDAAKAEGAVAVDGGAPEADDGVEAPPPPGQSAEPGTTDATVAAAAEGGVVLPSFLRMELRRGFFVSVDGEETDAARRFLRTVRGSYVRADRLIPNEPPTHRGVVLGGSWALPVGFVYRRGVRRLARDPETAALRLDGEMAVHTPLVVAGSLTRGTTDYVISQRGAIVRRGAVRVAERAARPRGVGADARWIHVKLGEQTLVAYEGDTPVFATIVSTGREGFETPTGLFRVQSKHVSTTMDDLTSDDGAYLIEDVPWTMYFEGNFALHGAFWHSSFGLVRSHGCVNLAPADARWIFQWSTPTLPASWHGVFADRERAGTWVFIEP